MTVTGTTARLAELGSGLSVAVERRRQAFITTAVENLGFVAKDVAGEIDLVTYLLRRLDRLSEWIEGRRPATSDDQAIALLLPYNAISWPVWDIANLLGAGNRARIRMSSRAGRLADIVQDVVDEVAPGRVVVDQDRRDLFLFRVLDADEYPVLIAYGSEQLGDKLFRQSVEHQKIVFEGPGKDPFLVLSGAEPADIARTVVAAKLGYSGQQCIAPELLLVHESIYEQLVAFVVRYMSEARVGDPSDPVSDVGPMGSHRIAPIITSQIQDALRQGAHVACGGTIDGEWVEPTVITDVTPRMAIFQDETFGPVLSVSVFASVEEGIALARSTRFGLHCSVAGDDAARVALALRGKPYADAVEALTFGSFGTTSVDSPLFSNADDAFSPFGGYGVSGWIREGTHLRQGPKLFMREATMDAAT